MYVWYKNLKNLLGQGIFVVQFFSLVELPLQLPPWVSFCIFTRTWCLTPVSRPCPHDFEHEDSSFQSPHTQSTKHFKNIFGLWKCTVFAGSCEFQKDKLCLSFYNIRITVTHLDNQYQSCMGSILWTCCHILRGFSLP